MKEKIICIVGPTASGKTSLSIELAKKINAEIISADSMQIYKGLDIGTAKVKEEEARKKKGREILKLWYDGSLDQLVSDLYSAEDEDEEDN